MSAGSTKLSQIHWHQLAVSVLAEILLLILGYLVTKKFALKSLIFPSLIKGRVRSC